jgi:hypothetical protein
VLKGRQGGISTDQQARNLHQICTAPGFDAMTLAHIRDDTDKLFAITQRAVENYPEFLRTPFGSGMAREISIPEMDATFYTGTAGAKRTGRGLTLKRVHGSEFAFWDQPRQTLAAITPALVPSQSVVTLETTASWLRQRGPPVLAGGRVGRQRLPGGVLPLVGMRRGQLPAAAHGAGRAGRARARRA